MSEFGLIFVIVAVLLLGMQIGFAIGMERTQKRLISEILDARQEVASMRFIVRMRRHPMRREVNHG